ncbi:MAG: ergothioneine biosynthesis protein EgtB [Steroidobacteraceae bacterium]
MSHSESKRTVSATAASYPLLADYKRVRAQSEALTQPLSEADCEGQSMPDASPAKWHLAHTSWFFETFLLKPCAGYEPLDASYERLFNSYYNSIGEQFPRASRGLLTRPSLAEVMHYRRHVDSGMTSLLSSRELPDDQKALVELGLNHEQQHQELILTDIKHLLAQNPQKPAYRSRWPLASVRPAPSQWIAGPSGLISIGHVSGSFAFDNEMPAHRHWLEPFELASRPVTNAEYLAFIEDGGYERPELWLSDGWAAARAALWQAPGYWYRAGDQWRCFTLHGDSRLDPHAPVCHVSFYEAEAFARWAGARLPTEFEWESLARTIPVQGNFLESGAFHPLAQSRGPVAGAMSQMFGDVWEWTRSDYAPYPGFAPAAGAVGEYNGKFMSGQYVLRGGSCATAGDHVRATYRNFFPPQARWQFSGIRLARDPVPASRTCAPAGERAASSQGQPRTTATKQFRQAGTLDSSAQRQALCAGLLAQPAVLSPKYFYDVLGSKLFDAITELPEYYPTRTEADIFGKYASQMAREIRELLGQCFQMLEPGAGSCEKAARLFPVFRPKRFIAVDVSAEYLAAQIGRLQRRFADIQMVGVGMDFSRRFELPDDIPREPTLVFYPGSSLGNFEPPTRQRLLREMRTSSPATALLLGVDFVKDKAELESAYNDALGLTAAFNLNALRHVNTLIDANFDPGDWSHVAVFNETAARIEMYLQARHALTVRWSDGERRFQAGERLRTEHSYKWTATTLRDMLSEAGYDVVHLWADDAHRFGVVLATAARAANDS